jgi:hypothetical protein
MPLYTYVLTHRGETVVLQERRSNYRGWMAMVVGRAFPKLPKRDLQAAWEVDPEPSANLTNVWRGSAEVSGAELAVTIIETRQ